MISKMAELFLESEQKDNYKYALQKVYQYEQINGCNIYELDEKELVHCLEDKLSDVGVNSITSYTSRFTKYFEWLERNNYYKFKYNYRNTISIITKNLTGMLELHALSQRDVYAMANSCKNIEDGIILALVFEGVNGGETKYGEITNIRYNDLKGTRLSMSTRI